MSRSRSSVETLKTRKLHEIARVGVRALLKLAGQDPRSPGLEKTPLRVVSAFCEMTQGYDHDPETILSTTFDVKCDELVLVKGISFTSLCEHHLLPFTGKATVGYIPRVRVVGLSKLARLVDCYSLRLQVQERLTEQIAKAIQKYLNPIGTAVVIEATHQCMSCRGVKKPAATMVTSALLGVFRSDRDARAEFMTLACA